MQYQIGDVEAKTVGGILIMDNMEIKECCEQLEGNACCENTDGDECRCDKDVNDSCKHGEHKDCCKHTVRNEEERKKLINRLNRIEGQIRGIRAMVERNAYCPDILMQSAAVNAAVNSFNKDLIASHIKHCVVRDVREGNDEVIAELVETLQKLMK